MTHAYCYICSMARMGDTRITSRGTCVGLLLLLAIVIYADPLTATPPRFTLEATVVDAEGNPLDAFTVKVLARGANDPQIHALTDAGGVIEMGIDEPFDAIAVDAPGHATWFHSSVVSLEGRYDIGRVQLARERVLSGRVIDAATGAPVAGAVVRYLPHEGMFGTTSRANLQKIGSLATTDGDGDFTLDDLPSQNVHLLVAADGYAFDARGIALPANANRLEIPLESGATIEGSLSLTSGGMATGEVRLSPAETPWTWTEKAVGPGGRFRFEHVTPGSYRLSVRSTSGVAERRDVHVVNGDHLVFELHLEPLGGFSGWIDGLQEGESVWINVYRNDDPQSHVRGSDRAFGNGPFEMRGLADGSYVVGATVAGGRKLTTRVEVVDGAGIANFAFVGRSQLSGRVLAGARPLPRMNVAVNPLHPALPSAYTLTDEAGRFELNGLGDGEYEIEVHLGSRGTTRSFAVTVLGDTTLDARLGPYSISGRLAPNFRNHFVQARLLDRTDEPVIHRVFVDGSGRYRFDGLDPGDYVVTHSSPHYGEIIEVRIFGASVEDLDFNPTYERGLAIPVIDAESKEPLESAICEINEGPWAGTSFGQYKQQRLRFPTTLAHTDMTCTSEGYEPAHVLWGGGPLSLELKPAGTE